MEPAIPQLAVHSWSAWAPGLETRDDWLRWAANPWLPSGDQLPALRELPAMLRRRLSAVGRAALQVAWQCQGEQPGCPTVFASRYGDVRRSLAEIETMMGDEPISPTAFATSVHNSIGALYSIARGQTEDLTCVAAGTATAAAGFIEAACLIKAGAEQVLLVCYDEPLPVDYSGFADEAPALWAFAWLLRPATASDNNIALRCRGPTGGKTVSSSSAAGLPAGLQVLHFLVSARRELSQVQGKRCWEWSRGAV